MKYDSTTPFMSVINVLSYSSSDWLIYCHVTFSDKPAFQRQFEDFKIVQTPKNTICYY